VAVSGGSSWGESIGFSSHVRHRSFSGRISNPPLHYLHVAMNEDDHALEHVAVLERSGECPACRSASIYSRAISPPAFR
jgi:hypothetical protein